MKVALRVKKVGQHWPKLYSYMRKCRLKYLEHVLHADKLATAKAQIAAEQLAATAQKRIFYIYIEQYSSVQTAKTEKICVKMHTPHRTCTCRSCMSV